MHRPAPRVTGETLRRRRGAVSAQSRAEAADDRGVCTNRFPGYCAHCAAYVATGAGVYVRATIRVYCPRHAPDGFEHAAERPTRAFADARCRTRTPVTYR